MLPVITQVILPSFCTNKLQVVEIFHETCPAILPHCMMQTTYLSRYSYTLIHWTLTTHCCCVSVIYISKFGPFLKTFIQKIRKNCYEIIYYTICMHYKYYYKVIVSLVYDVPWGYDDKLKPTINSFMFDYIRTEWNFTNSFLLTISILMSKIKSIKFLQGP